MTPIDVTKQEKVFKKLAKRNISGKGAAKTIMLSKENKKFLESLAIVLRKNYSMSASDLINNWLDELRNNTEFYVNAKIREAYNL